MLAQTQGHVQAAQRVGVVAKLLNALFLVAERDLCAQLHKLLNAALVADARADKGNLLTTDKLLQPFDWQHKNLSPAELFFFSLYTKSPVPATKFGPP